MPAHDVVDLTGDYGASDDDGNNNNGDDKNDEPVGVNICADIEDLLDLDNNTADGISNNQYGTKKDNHSNKGDDDDDLFGLPFASKARQRRSATNANIDDAEDFKLSMLNKRTKKAKTKKSSTEQKSTKDGGQKKNQAGRSKKRKRDEEQKMEESQTSTTINKHNSKRRKGAEKSKQTKAAERETKINLEKPLCPSGKGDQNSGNNKSVGESTNDNSHSKKKKRNRRKKKKKAQLTQTGNEGRQEQEGGARMPPSGEEGQTCSGSKPLEAPKKRKKKRTSKGGKETKTNQQDSPSLPSSTTATNRGISMGKRHNTSSTKQPPAKVARTKVPPPAVMKKNSSKRKLTKAFPAQQPTSNDKKQTPKPATSAARLPVELGDPVGVDICVDIEDLMAQQFEASDGIGVANWPGKMAGSVDVGPWDWVLGRKDSSNTTDDMNHMDIERSIESAQARQQKDRLETKAAQSYAAMGGCETKKTPLSSDSAPPASPPKLSGVPKACSKPKHVKQRVLKGRQPIVVEIPSDSDDEPGMDAKVSEKVDPTKAGRETPEKQCDGPSTQCQPATPGNMDVPASINKQAALRATMRLDQPLTATRDKQAAARYGRTEGSSSTLKPSTNSPDETMTGLQSSLGSPGNSNKRTNEEKRNQPSPCRNFIVIDDSSDDGSDGEDVEFVATVKDKPGIEEYRSSTNNEPNSFAECSNPSDFVKRGAFTNTHQFREVAPNSFAKPVWSPKKDDNVFQKVPSTQNNSDGFMSSIGNPFRATHQQKRSFQNESAFHKDRDFNFEISQKVALEQQERLLRASLERVRSRESHQPPRTAHRASSQRVSYTPPLFSSPVQDVHQSYPDHWKWRDPYARLGLQPNADVALVKRHYRKLALVYHPDKKRFDDSSTRFQAITAAYRKLT